MFSIIVAISCDFVQYRELMLQELGGIFKMKENAGAFNVSIIHL